MHPRYITKKQSKRKKNTVSINSSVTDKLRHEETTELDRAENIPAKAKPSDVMTHEQFCEIESLYKTDKAVWRRIDEDLSTGFCVMLPIFALDYMRENYSFAPLPLPILFALLMAAKNTTYEYGKLIYYKENRLKRITLAEIEKFTYDEAESYIEKAKTVLAQTTKLSKTSLRIKRFSVIYNLWALFLYAYSNIFTNNAQTYTDKEINLYILIVHLISSFTNANDLEVSDKRDEKMRNLHINLNKLVEKLNLKWSLHKKENLLSSYYILSTKQGQLSIPSKVLSNLIAMSLRRNGIDVLLLKDSYKLSVYGDIKLDSTLAEKITDEIHLSIQIYQEIETLKNQLYIIARELQIFFTFKQTSNQLTPIFEAISSVNENINPTVYAELQKLFTYNIYSRENSIVIRQTNSIPADQLSAFFTFLKTIEVVLPKSSTYSSSSTEPSSSSFFKAKTKRQPKDKTAEKTETKDLVPNIKAPTTPPTLRKPSKWASGAVYDHNKPAEQQEVKPFISGALPNNKFFMVSLLTKKDFEASSLTYLEDHFMQQIAYPSLAKHQNDQGVILNLFGTQHDAQGNAYSINGKIKCKGNQMGDIRAYFDYESNEDNQVLCRVKNIKFKAHKQRK